nr:hypothetical protein BHI3_31410 [Bacteriovorax sp. HI3]
MKAFLFALTLLAAIPAFAENNCSIFSANQMDNTSRVCTGNKTGVAFHNTLISCHDNEFEAQKALNKIQSCHKQIKNNNCSLLAEGLADVRGAVCTPGYIAVTYKGATISTFSCYKTLDKAIKVMESEAICNEQDTTGDFAILYPSMPDNQGSRCKNSFGVTYKGVIASKVCYNSIERAIKEMKELSSQI